METTAYWSIFKVALFPFYDDDAQGKLDLNWNYELEQTFCKFRRESLLSFS